VEEEKVLERNKEISNHTLQADKAAEQLKNNQRYNDIER